LIYYLDKNQIIKLASNSDVYKRGEAYKADGKVRSIAFEETADADKSYNAARAKVEGNYSEYNVDIMFDKNGILQKYRCDCDAFGVWRGGCKHVVAALLKLYEMNMEAAAQSRLNRAASGLLSVFEKQALDEIDMTIGSAGTAGDDGVGGKIELRPRLCSEGENAIFLTFSVGRKRLYIIKNVTEFANNIINGAEASYGKGLAFAHKKSLFDEKSVKLVDFILSEYENYSQMVKSAARGFWGSNYYGASALSGRKLPLSKRGLDYFFSLYAGEAVEAEIYALQSKTILLTDDLPDIKFGAVKTADGVELTADKAAFTAFEGEGDGYLAFEGSFHRVPYDYYNTIMPIRRTFAMSSNKNIVFAKREYGRLSTFLLPKLRKYGLIDDTLDLSDELKQYELIKRVYIDVAGSAVTCKLVFCYGGVEINALDNKRTAFMRNTLEERVCVNMLAQMGFTTSGDKYVLNGNDVIFDFYNSDRGIESLRKNCEVYATDEFLNKSVKPPSSAQFGLRIDGALLRVDINTDGYSREELLDILESYQLKKRFHRLKDGSFISLGEGGDSLGAAAELISGLGLTDKDIINGSAELPKFRALYAEQILERNRELEASKNKAFVKLTNDIAAYRALDFDVPETLENILRPYQKEGFNWLKALRFYGFGGILADDMGLGKTLEIISVILSEKLEERKNGVKPKPSIIVAPTSLIYNWEKEFNRFAPELSVTTIAGAAAKRHENIAVFETPDAYITTYDMLKRDIEHYKNIEFQYIIADEAQNIKNPLTQNARCVKELNGETRFALTGTPIENSLSELWSIFDFAMPGYLWNAAKFSRHYEVPIIKNDDKTRASELRRQIAPFILRRVKRDVLKELPDKIETTLYADMTDEQRKIYAAYLSQAKGELEDVIKAGKYKEKQIEILSMLTRLRQICCHPATFIEGYEGGSGKLDLTGETVGAYIEGGHRMLIFSQFTKMLAIIRRLLDDNGVEYFYLDGATPSMERLQMAERFNSGFGQVFLISLKAGGTGLNLTGADTVIHYDPWWNPAVMDQASDRAHRFGQKRTVQVINIVAKDTIEERIIALQTMKKDLVDTVIQEGANFIGKMSEDDILSLFSE